MVLKEKEARNEKAMLAIKYFTNIRILTRSTEVPRNVNSIIYERDYLYLAKVKTITNMKMGRNKVFKSKFSMYLLGEAGYSPSHYHVDRVQPSTFNMGEITFIKHKCSIYA